MATYRVQSIQTNLVIAYTGNENRGALVISDRGPGTPLHHHLTFSAPVFPGGISLVTVKQYNGLYIGLDKDIGRLVWSKDAFEWLVTRTGPGYRFFPKDGEDLYWYQNRRIEPEVGAEAGSELVDDEPLFALQRV